MTNHFRRIAAPLALTCALFAGACKNDRAADDTTLAADSSLNRDLSLAGGDSAAQPQLTDTATPAPAPVATPAPAKARPTTSSNRPRTSTRTPTPEPTKRTTPTGNTEEKTAAGSERSVATIPAGTSINF